MNLKFQLQTFKKVGLSMKDYLMKMKSIYDTEPSPEAWFDWLQQFLISVGFVSSNTDSSLFLKFTNQSIMFLLVYVHDIMSQEAQLLRLNV